MTPIPMHTVKAPHAVSSNPLDWMPYRMGVTSGAWFTRLLGRGVWRTEFAGTHQRVPFHAIGRTPGRSLRVMRRALDRAMIPAVIG
jgi:hypothetical protein